ncbi:hypothetical protein KSP40_PGU018010 [Platanthera guangdongensis]|uniref:Uncharacterized protein n=1 Tax=Platanthera guangdongensis TaxID=2320717 RepID=A0ABR2MU49_9ASPA
MVHCEAYVRRRYSAHKHQLRMLAGGLWVDTGVRPLFLPRYAHLPRIFRHEFVLPGQGQEHLEL